MRILMTTDTIGGVWTFTQELANALLSRGCEIALVSAGREPSETQMAWCRQTQHRWVSNFRYEALNVPLEWMENNDRASEDDAPALVRVAEEFGAEIVHSNQFCFGALPLNVPKIVTAHSDVLSWADSCRNGRLE